MTINVKRAAAVLALGVLLVANASGIAAAQEKVGVIDPQKVLFQHPKFQEVQRQIKSVVDKKQQEARTAIEQTSDNQQKQQIFEKKRQEAAMEEQKLMEPLFKDIDLAIRTVAKLKSITVVLDKGQVFFGGTDITEDVIQELKKKYATN
ncbi:MAG TPA: HlpA protein [Synergistaceae bacterium]|nr:MAG: Outer membrane chaperone Skp (OmpH) [Synergistales bacterium 53_16]KUL03034.1 MAG: Outer membrane chaperone Skp (OmpH) [Synergistales bacterium 54_9]MDK2845669.1 outer membrane protein [Synergistales bacterium]HAA47900.1 HlpA protein [Synergistaceae bacterium]MDN5336419.1 outer membrane protein [Synergistales bacterium]